MKSKIIKRVRRAVRKKTSSRVPKKLIIANWKMNPDNMRDARKIFNDLKRKNLKTKNSIAVICPPTLFLGDLAHAYRGNKFVFGAQDVSWRDDIESTGEVSVSMLKNLGVKYVIVGHSERREIGDTNEVVAAKTRHILDAGLTPVLCIGEVDRDRDGSFLRFIEEQLHDSLAGVAKNKVSKIVIAYEPVWAVGQGHEAVSSDDIHQMIIFIRKVLSNIYGSKVAMSVPVLYGGSVDADNCEDILNTAEVKGLLVGRASLNPHVFADILKKVG